jgi:hypothetical protein
MLSGSTKGSIIVEYFSDGKAPIKTTLPLLERSNPSHPIPDWGLWDLSLCCYRGAWDAFKAVNL